jgi:hypothetical protein
LAAGAAACAADVSVAADFEALRCRRRLDFFTACLAVSAGVDGLADVGTADALVWGFGVAFFVVPWAPATPAIASSANDVRRVRDRIESSPIECE